MESNQLERGCRFERTVDGARRLLHCPPLLGRRGHSNLPLLGRRGDLLICALLLLCMIASCELSSASPARAADMAAEQASPAPNLNLTPLQQQKLAALESASGAQAGQLTEQIKQLRGKLADLYRAYNLDPNDAKRLNGQLNAVQGQLLDLRLSEQVQLRAILTADQFGQLQAAIKQPGEWRGHRHERGRHA